MKTKSDLEKLVRSIGGTLEEDTSFRDTRVFQLVSPAGTRWHDSNGLHLRVEWARGNKPHAIAYNESTFRDAVERVNCGLEMIPESDAYLYAED